jgi:NADH:ubiquinone oxidoreductase subunit F (NADH-binding)
MKKITVLIFLTIPLFLFAQDENIQIGSSMNQLRQSQGAFFDYSNPESINIKVAIWGFVRYPGKYIIPMNSTVNDLLSYSGGPTEDAHLDEIKIVRTEADSTQRIINLHYEDIMWNEINRIRSKDAPILAGDVLVVPGEERLYFRDYFSITLSVISTLISLSILILNIVQ